MQKTISEIQSAYAQVFNADCTIVKHWATLELRAKASDQEVRPAEIVQFCRLLGTDNMVFDFETDHVQYSLWTAGSEHWRVITIYTDYWGWVEGRKEGST